MQRLDPELLHHILISTQPHFLTPAHLRLLNGLKPVSRVWAHAVRRILKHHAPSRPMLTLFREDCPAASRLSSWTSPSRPSRATTTAPPASPRARAPGTSRRSSATSTTPRSVSPPCASGTSACKSLASTTHACSRPCAPSAPPQKSRTQPTAASPGSTPSFSPACTSDTHSSKPGSPSTSSA
jgi:hypothetical protein